MRITLAEKFSKEELAQLPFNNDNLDLEERVEDLLARLTLDEKFKLCTGRWWALFHMRPIKRLGIKAFKMTDGPCGVGALGTYFKKKVTYFPVPICRCATWNPELSEQFGVAAGQEARAAKRQMLLAPGLNIHRSPLCGRSARYKNRVL